MHERRQQRASTVSGAVENFLATLCRASGLDGAALTTNDGLLIAGVGAFDVEWMGALGASTSKRSLTWEKKALHVSRFDVNDVSLCLTTAGGPLPESKTVGAIGRILATAT
ncbi:MAG: hypothetical protein JNG84_03780 [Archangium sp.]|nr:hypothetical protein [Archangium sp.]